MNGPSIVTAAWSRFVNGPIAGEREDHLLTESTLLPLDGGLKRRLINMRIRQERKAAVRVSGNCDLYSRFRSLSHFKHLRSREQKALGRWFLRQETYRPKIKYMFTPVHVVDYLLAELTGVSKEMDRMLTPARTSTDSPGRPYQTLCPAS